MFIWLFDFFCFMQYKYEYGYICPMCLTTHLPEILSVWFVSQSHGGVYWDEVSQKKSWPPWQPSYNIDFAHTHIYIYLDRWIDVYIFKNR